MSTEREELADLLMSDRVMRSDAMGRDYALVEADAVLAWMEERGYRKQEPVSDAEVEAATEALTIRRHTPAGWASPDVARAALVAAQNVRNEQKEET